MISNTDYNNKVKILQNTCVFTVRLHLRHVDNVRRKLAGGLFFSICYWYTSESVSGPPSGLDLDPIWVPKIDVRNMMALRLASKPVWERFWLPKWLPKRGPKKLRTRFPMDVSLKARKTRFLQALCLHYQHCEDAICH